MKRFLIVVAALLFCSPVFAQPAGWLIDEGASFTGSSSSFGEVRVNGTRACVIGTAVQNVNADPTPSGVGPGAQSCQWMGNKTEYDGSLFGTATSNTSKIAFDQNVKTNSKWNTVRSQATINSQGEVTHSYKVSGNFQKYYVPVTMKIQALTPTYNPGPGRLKCMIRVQTDDDNYIYVDFNYLTNKWEGHYSRKPTTGGVAETGVISVPGGTPLNIEKTGYRTVLNNQPFHETVSFNMPIDGWSSVDSINSSHEIDLNGFVETETLTQQIQGF